MPGIPFSLAAPHTPTVLSLCLFWSTNRCRFQRCPQIHWGANGAILNWSHGLVSPTCLKDETSSWDLVQQQLGTWKWCTKSRIFSLVSWFEIKLLVRVYRYRNLERTGAILKWRVQGLPCVNPLGMGGLWCGSPSLRRTANSSILSSFLHP